MKEGIGEDDPVRATGGVGDQLPALPEAAWWVALAGLPGMGPARLAALRSHLAGEGAWAAVRERRAHHLAPVAGAMGPRAADVAEAWARAAARIEVGPRWAAHAHLDVSVLGDPAHPARLAQDVEPPVVLFSQGDRAALDGPTVAIVGTRRCTPAGAEIAVEVGAACARAGARVVSGLALGIDMAAHRGALSVGPGGAPPVAVVATGLDVIYPTRSRALWQAVAQAGVVLSEHPLGTEPARWRFPARNRIIAALADVVVVVESRRAGGSMYTVDEALRRDRTVLAVPGPMRSAASAGTNWLLSQGATVVSEPADVLVAAGLAPGSGPGSGLDPRPRPTGDSQRILKALGWAPATLEVLAERTSLGLGALAVALDHLEADGWIRRQGGRVEQRARP